MIGNIIPKAFGFVLLPVYTSYLGPEEYGIVNSMEVFSSIMVVVFTLGLERSIYRLYFDCTTLDEKKTLLGTIQLFQLFLSVAMIGAVWLFQEYVGGMFESIPFMPYYAVAVAGTFLSIFPLVLKVSYQVEEHAGKFLVLSLAQFFITTSLIIFFVVIREQGAFGMLLGMALSNLALVPLCVVLLKDKITLTFDGTVLKQSLSFSLPYIPILLSAWVLNFFDRIFIERFFTLTDVGLYSLGFKIASLVLVVTSSLHQSYFPTYFRVANKDSGRDAPTVLGQYNFLYILAVFVISFLVALFSKDVCRLFFDERYQDAYSLIPILSMGILFSQASGIYNLSFQQAKKTSYQMYLVLVSACISLCLNFVFVRYFGAMGAAFSSLIAYVSYFFLGYWLSKRALFIPFRWRPFLILVIVFLATVIPINYYFELKPFLSLSIKATISIAFLWILYRTSDFKILLQT